MNKISRTTILYSALLCAALYLLPGEAKAQSLSDHPKQTLDNINI